MSISEIINLTAILLGPIIAVSITLWWQRRKEKRDAKIGLFLTLMTHRKSSPPSPEWVNALNIIDVVFADVPQVVELWHRYYENLSNPPANQNFQSRDHIFLLMLSAMARCLGYHKLEQTDIDKFYSPVAHGNQARLNLECQTEWLRVLKNTSKINTEIQNIQPEAQQDAREEC